MPYLEDEHEDENGGQVGDDLRKAANLPEVYPPHLLTATRAEFVTRVRKNKKPCGMLTLLILWGLFWIVYLVVAP